MLNIMQYKINYHSCLEIGLNDIALHNAPSYTLTYAKCMHFA